MAYTSEHAQDALSKYGVDGDPVKKKKKESKKPTSYVGEMASTKSAQQSKTLKTVRAVKKGGK